MLLISADVLFDALVVKGSAVAVKDMVTKVEDLALPEFEVVVPDVPSG